MDFMHIESDANKKIKLAASLHQRKSREKEGLFLAEGVRLCEMAAESSWKIRFALVTDQLLSTERGRTLADRLSSITEVCLATEKIFLKAAALCGTAPEETWVVEDSFNGIRAAQRAGMRPVMVPDLLEPDEEMRMRAEAVLPDLFQVRDYLGL